MFNLLYIFFKITPSLNFDCKAIFQSKYNYNKVLQSGYYMLNNLLSVAASTRYGHIINVMDQSLVISNYHIFLWKVLPKYAKSIIHRTKFIKQMKKAGFIQSDQFPNSQFSIQFDGQPFILQKIKQLQIIRQSRFQSTQKLKQKTEIIKKLILTNHSNKIQDLTNHLELLQLVSSLKQINRSIYSLKIQQSEIIRQCQEWISYKLQFNTNTEEMIYFQQQTKPNTKLHNNYFYSFNILHS